MSRVQQSNLNQQARSPVKVGSISDLKRQKTPPATKSVTSHIWPDQKTRFTTWKCPWPTPWTCAVTTTCTCLWRSWIWILTDSSRTRTRWAACIQHLLSNKRLHHPRRQAGTLILQPNTAHEGPLKINIKKKKHTKQIAIVRAHAIFSCSKVTPNRISIKWNILTWQWC